MRASSFSWLAIAIFTFALLGAGCLQPASVDRCVNSPDRTGCLTFYATWYQEPETCYYINDLSTRVSCLNSSTDSLAAQRLQDSYAAYGQLPSSNPRPSPTPAANAPAANSSTSPSYAPPVPLQLSAQSIISNCVSSTPKATADACAKQLAIEGHNLTYCAFVVSPDLRSSCILATATNIKDASQCTVFNSSVDRQFCIYYSRAG